MTSSWAGLDPKDELNEMRRTILGLANEIDYKNYKLSELEFKYNDTKALFCKVTTGLTEIVNAKDQALSELEHKLRESSEARERLASENVRLMKQCSEELSAMQAKTINLENGLERRRYELERLAKEFEQSTAQKNLEQKDLKDEIEKLKEMLKSQNQAEIICNSDTQIDVLANVTEEKDQEIEYYKTLNSTLASRDFQSNNEVNECRKELISGLQEILTKRTKLVIKRMGELDQNPFLELCYKKIPNEDWQGLAAKMCSYWQEQIMDPHWHPFKIVTSDDGETQIVNEEDEKVRLVRDEYGESAFEAVRRALLEMNEYNPSGRYAVPEIWVEKEKRKASLTEIVRYIVEKLKAKKKRKRVLVA